MSHVLIYDAVSESDVHITKGFLESHGIKAFLGGGHNSAGRYGVAGPLGLYVEESDKEEAIQLLKERSN